ncbi:F-box protein [Sporobolomyces salmoneus]|uniref:F-box protein n=1 Tax=Sporobolomyces salmoneus TaxID=183962 RepID=UPI00316F0758
MSFAVLPPELLGDIFTHATEPGDLYRIALVSKLWYHEAMPLLFEAVCIDAGDSDTRLEQEVLRGVTFGTWSMELDDFKAKIDKDDKNHDGLMQALRRDPHVSQWIKRLGIHLYHPDPPNSKDTFVADTVQIVRASQNLQFLELRNFYVEGDHDESQIRDILSHVSPSVVELDVSRTSLSTETVLHLLCRLPQLKVLLLGGGSSIGEWKLRSMTCEIPHLVHLEKLALTFPFRGKAFLRKILSHTLSLTRLQCDPLAVQALQFPLLSTVKDLVISGNFATSLVLYTPRQFVRDLVATLQFCTTLKTFALVSEENKKEEEHAETEEEDDDDDSGLAETSKLLEELNFLQYLPRTVWGLGLFNLPLSPEYVLSFLHHEASSEVKKVCLSCLNEKWFEGDEDEREAKEDEIEEVCHVKAIDIEWYKEGKIVVSRIERKGGQ